MTELIAAVLVSAFLAQQAQNASDSPGGVVQSFLLWHEEIGGFLSEAELISIQPGPVYPDVFPGITFSPWGHGNHSAFVTAARSGVRVIRELAVGDRGERALRVAIVISGGGEEVWRYIPGSSRAYTRGGRSLLPHSLTLSSLLSSSGSFQLLEELPHRLSEDCGFVVAEAAESFSLFLDDSDGVAPVKSPFCTVSLEPLSGMPRSVSFLNSKGQPVERFVCEGTRSFKGVLFPSRIRREWFGISSITGEVSVSPTLTFLYECDLQLPYDEFFRLPPILDTDCVAEVGDDSVWEFLNVARPFSGLSAQAASGSSRRVGVFYSHPTPVAYSALLLALAAVYLWRSVRNVGAGRSWPALVLASLAGPIVLSDATFTDSDSQPLVVEGESNSESISEWERITADAAWISVSSGLLPWKRGVQDCGYATLAAFSEVMGREELSHWALRHLLAIEAPASALSVEDLVGVLARAGFASYSSPGTVDYVGTEPVARCLLIESAVGPHWILAISEQGVEKWVTGPGSDPIEPTAARRKSVLLTVSPIEAGMRLYPLVTVAAAVGLLLVGIGCGIRIVRSRVSKHSPEHD